MKEMKFFVVRKKRLIAIIIAVIMCIAIGGGTYVAVTGATPPTRLTVVVDAGHGGIDAGVVGKAGTKESEFNLLMAKELGKALSQAGFRVVYTRKSSDGLYGKDTKDFKRRDMAARKKVIVDADADLVVSVHANKFPGDDRRGAQVFYDDLNAAGKDVASLVQNNFNVLNEKNVGRAFEPLSGDYYILKCTQKPSIIVECGFLSNPSDEELLNDPIYRKTLAEAIAGGVSDYFAAGGKNYA